MQHISINGISSEHLSVMDRGLHYGDGLFETIACVDGCLQFWDEHVARMRHGAKQLAIELVAIDYFKSDVLEILQKQKITNCVIKLILTRGQGKRGYRAPSHQKNTRIVIISNAPEYPETYAAQGIKACFCQHPVSKNAALAGIKHLNRLDNVLARNEWVDEFQEGIMLDDSGNVIEGTMTNIFSIYDNKLYTPSLSLSGVDGIIRQQILSISEAQGVEINIVDIKKEHLENMDEIFVCNSVIGIWPVSSLAEANYEIGSLTKELSKALQERMSA